MNIFAMIGAVIQLLFVAFKRRCEKDAEKQKKLKEAYDEIATGIKERDPSKITGGFNSANNS